MKAPCRKGRRAMQGQAMVEFAVGAGLLLLLLAGTLVLWGYQDVQRHVLLASRHAAFLAAWHDPRQGEALQAHLAGLHFIHTDEARQVREAHLGVRTTTQASPGPAATASTALLAPLRIVGGFLGAGFDLSTAGYRASQVVADVAVPPLLAATGIGGRLDLSATMFLFGDAWNASGSAQVATRTAGLAPTSVLAGFADLWRAVAAPLALLEPALGKLCPGLIEPERVPDDRLDGAARGAVGEARCH